MKFKNLFLLPLILIIIASFSSCEDKITENNYYYPVEDSLDNPNVDLRIIHTFPENGSIGPLVGAQQITIQFNKLINIKTFDPQSIYLTDGDEYISINLLNNTSIIFANILAFEISQQYLANKTYTLTIDTTLIDIHGKRLKKPYVTSFTPEPEFRFKYWYPTGNDVEPGSFSHIFLAFNSKIDSSIFSSFSITPNLEGYWTLNDNNYYPDSTQALFKLSNDADFNTTYTVKISASAKDHQGLNIDKPYEFTFTTVPFRIRLQSYSSYTGPGGFYISNNFTFGFNGMVDTSTIRNAFTVTPQISNNLTISYNDYVGIQFNDNEFLPNSKYTIKFDSSVKSTKGDPLEEYTYSFTTGK